MVSKWNKLAGEKIVRMTAKSLKNNGMNVLIAENGQDACKMVFSLIPDGAEVFTSTSVTLDNLGISNRINNSDKYSSVRNKLNKMDRKKEGREMRKTMTSPDYIIGSAHAVSQDGKLLIASNTGSQLAPYSYSAGKVILVVGTQKIVENVDEGIKRIYEHTLPLESERARKAYGVEGSFVSKLLIINKEIQKDRMTIILVPEVLGF